VEESSTHSKTGMYTGSLCKQLYYLTGSTDWRGESVQLTCLIELSHLFLQIHGKIGHGTLMD